MVRCLDTLSVTVRAIYTTYLLFLFTRLTSNRLLIPREGGTPLYGLYGDVPLDRLWFLASLS